MNRCDKCGYLHYRTDPCREPKNSEPVARDRTDPPRSGAATRKDAGLPAPKPKFDKVAYMREYMRKRRAAQKATK